MKDQETTQRGDKCKADNKKNPLPTRKTNTFVGESVTLLG